MEAGVGGLARSASAELAGARGRTPPDAALTDIGAFRDLESPADHFLDSGAARRVSPH
ncbi:MAG: hypothetical protein QOJ66_2998 [Ilumatobacteraceae bacterium]|jgi:hypothetical protein